MQHEKLTRAAVGCIAIGTMMTAIGCSTGTKSGRAATGDDVLDVGSSSFDNASYGTGATSGGMVEMNSTAPAAPEYVAPEPAPVAPAAPAAARQHTIARGDTAWSLAVRYYGDGKQFPRIFQANPGLSERNFPAGKTIVIP